MAEVERIRQDTMDWNELSNPATLSMLVPIIVMVGWILARIMKHRERMAMIEKGMNPDTRTAQVTGLTYVVIVAVFVIIPLFIRLHHDSGQACGG